MSTGTDSRLLPWQQWIAALHDLLNLIKDPSPNLDAIGDLAQTLEDRRRNLPSAEVINAHSPLWPLRQEITSLLQRGFELNEQVLSALQHLQQGLLSEQAHEQAKGQQLRRTLGAYQAQSTNDGPARFIDRHR